MRKGFLLLGAVAVLVLASPCCAQEVKKSLDYLVAWEGKYPSDLKENFWRDSNVLAMMRKNIPVELRKKILLGWNAAGEIIQTPILKKGDVLAVSVCKPHECSSHAARLYFNLRRQTVQMCWRETNEKTGKTLDVWIADKVKNLGIDACLQHDVWDGLAVYGQAAY